MNPPNIIWICTDQQRSDSLGCSGNKIARTPHIDSLAAAGTRFSRHITPMQICSPSRATMFTGLYPRHHELITNGMALNPQIPTLTGLLADAGYRTHSVGKQHLQPILAPAEFNMPDSRAFWRTDAADDWKGPFYGFQTIDLLLGESDTAAISGHYARWLKNNAPEAAALLKVEAAPEMPPADLDEIWRSAIPAELHYNSWISDRASRFIDQSSSDDPFFMFVSYPDPHHPFAPPIEYADRYKAEDMPLPRVDPGELDGLPDYYTDLFPTERGFRELYWAGLPDMEAGSMIATAGISDDSMRRAIAHT
ncbi:MAG: sulfatase, partial [Gammaproteobacteria bacterium]